MTLFSKQQFLRIFVRDRIILGAWCTAVVVNLAAWGLFAWRAWPLHTMTLVPLHYTIYFGIDRLGPWYELATPALVGLAAFIVNQIILWIMYEPRRAFAYTFALGTVFLELILCAALFFMLLLNV